MITTLLIATGTALLIVGLYPIVMHYLRQWAHNQIVYRAMMNLDTELEWIQGNG